jgi:hypothetical protein
MAAQVRVLRRRIRATQSMRKITKAQELIATSRIAKAQARVESARPRWIIRCWSSALTVTWPRCWW